MADKTEFLQAIDDAILDADSLERFINGSDSETVLTRLSAKYPTLQKALKELFENGGLPATPFKTKALMTASALVNGDYAIVTDDPVEYDNGVYIKENNTWVKSKYDIPKLISSLELSTPSKLFSHRLTDNVDSSLLEVVSLVPETIRKPNTLIEHFDGYTYKYYPNIYIETRWNDLQYWVRDIDVSDNVNLVNEAHFYEGFITKGGVSSYHPANKCAIIPLPEGVVPIRFGDGFSRIEKSTFYLFNSAGGRIASYYNDYCDISSPNASYIKVDLEYYDEETGEIVKEGNFERAKKAFFIQNPKYENSNTATGSKGLKDLTSVSDVSCSPLPSKNIYTLTPSGVEMQNPWFTSESTTGKGINFSQVIKDIKVFKGYDSIYVENTKRLRKLIVKRLVWNGTFAALTVDCESERGDWSSGYLASGYPDEKGIVTIKWARSLRNDPLVVQVTLDSNQFDRPFTISGEGVLSDYWLLNSDYVDFKPSSETFIDFSIHGISKVSSNYQYADAKPSNVSTSIVNGALTYSTTGEHDFNQATLIAHKRSHTEAEVEVFVDVDGDKNSPDVSVLNEPSSVTPFQKFGQSHTVLGHLRDSQYVHPDIEFSETPIAGFNYFMVSSNYPLANDGREDADIFVSNDGKDWTRVRGFYQDDDAGLGFKNPPIFWNTGYKNAFMPIPVSGQIMEFAKSGNIVEEDTITSYLNHDCAISVDSGYVNFYILYNLRLTDSPTRVDHKYVICVRTKNGTDWEIVREDGTTMPYNEQNAMKILSKSDGVRNHICYRHEPVIGVTGYDLSPQVVKVSEGEWYYYARTGVSSDVPSNNKLNIVRYKGTSPYSFDFDSPEEVVRDNNKAGALWHFCVRHYDGVFYLITNGFLLTSSDGVNFTSYDYPFFWRGMSSDLYKPSFTKSPDGSLKFAYGCKHLSSVPLASGSLLSSSGAMYTVLTEYPSLADIVNRSEEARPDGYADVVIYIISERTRRANLILLPSLRENTSFSSGVKMGVGDDIYIQTMLTTRNGGSVGFKGIKLFGKGALLLNTI